MTCREGSQARGITDSLCGPKSNDEDPTHSRGEAALYAWQRRMAMEEGAMGDPVSPDCKLLAWGTGRQNQESDILWWVGWS